METAEIKKRITKIVAGLDDKKFLANLYDLLQNKTEDKSNTDILSELTPKQLARLKSSMKQMDEGKGIPHDVVMTRLKKLSR